MNNTELRGCMRQARSVESMFIATRRPHLCDVCITSPVYRVYRLVLYTSRLSSYSLTALGSVVLIQHILFSCTYILPFRNLFATAQTQQQLGHD